MLTFFIIIFIIVLFLGSIFFNSIKNIITFILEKMVMDERTIEFIFSIIVVIIVLYIFGII